VEVNLGSLRTLGIGFQTTFENALTQGAPMYGSIATTVPSSVRSQDYGWLGKLPNVREWLGDRVLSNLRTFSYAIDNKDWESTIDVDRNDIEDDNLGIYNSMFAEMGASAAAQPDMLVWPLLNNGWANLCYDGQYFFDTDHPVLDVNGNPTSVANTDGGDGTPWFLAVNGRKVQPIIFQNRKPYSFVSKDAPTDENVFMRKKFLYGTDSRNNAGYGLWQFCWGSKQPLTPDSYETARAALIGMLGDFGRPLGSVDLSMYVPPLLEGAMKQILNADRNADGSTNIWFNTAKQVMVPWLAVQ